MASRHALVVTGGGPAEILPTDRLIEGVPSGGLIGQVLIKLSGTSYDTAWTPLATAADIWAGTDAGKIVTAKALRDAQVPQTLTYAASIAWDAALGFNAKIPALAGNPAFATPTNLVEGLTYTLRLKQDNTGNRMPTWSSAFNFGADGAPTLSTGAGKEDILAFLCIDATTPVLAFTGIRKGF